MAKRGAPIGNKNPERKFTDEQRKIIRYLAGCGATQAHIEREVDADWDTIIKHCKADYEAGLKESLKWCFQQQDQMIRGTSKGNFAALKHRLAVTHKLVEKNSVEHSGEGGGPLIIKWMD